MYICLVSLIYKVDGKNVDSVQKFLINKRGEWKVDIILKSNKQEGEMPKFLVWRQSNSKSGLLLCSLDWLIQDK